MIILPLYVLFTAMLLVSGAGFAGGVWWALRLVGAQEARQEEARDGRA